MSKVSVLWLTGLSGAGKTTLASALKSEFHNRKVLAVSLDGDDLRKGLCSDLGFSEEDRRENIRRSGEVAKILSDSGLLVIASFISPFRSDRNMVRSLFSEGEFIEVYVKAPLSVCEARDPKGLYKRARSGDIPNFTGIGSPYEVPESPDITLDTNKYSVGTCSAKVMEFLQEKDDG